jgi:hypothetical protein
LDTPGLHLAIATGQNLANLIPALQCGAKEVWVLQTPQMQRNGAAAHLADALKARGVSVRRIDFRDDDVTTLHAQAQSIAQQIGGRAVTINLTGGTKLMTLALVQTLAPDLETAPGACAPHLVYCDTSHRRLDWLAPVARSEAMQPVLKIDDVLLAQGYRSQGGSGGATAAEWQRNADARKVLTRWLGDHSQDIGRFFGQLNAAAQRAQPLAAEGPFSPEQGLDYVPRKAAADALRQSAGAGLLSWDERSTIVFLSRDAADYLGGGWVEEYAAAKLSGARANGGWMPRLRIEHVDTHTTNELDGALVHDNRLLLVECKAARSGDKTADWIYKLAQLARQVGGQLARPLLLSARTLGDADHDRAREYGVDVLDGSELRRLPEYLRAWMSAS